MKPFFFDHDRLGAALTFTPAWFSVGRVNVQDRQVDQRFDFRD
jgi:hypothetical protein